MKTPEPDVLARELMSSLASASGSQRLQSERDFHDRQAADRARSIRDYRFNDADYLNHESWIAPAMDALGDIHGQRLLDLGCGHGMASVVFARRGALVTACDLSLGYVREAATRAAANDVVIHTVVCNGECLPFADASFDRIWGNAILHHFDLRIAAMELRRVLAPDGIAVFCEPWAGNRLLNWARQRLLYPGKSRTADETPLRRCDVDQLRRAFPSLQTQGYQLLSMAGRVVKQPRLNASLAWCDRLVLTKWPHWQRYCRYVVVRCAKEPRK
jgi:SAM-dependent methyltransferase